MTWTNNFSKTFLIFASLIPFFRLIIPEKCFYQWILCHNFVYMKKFPWFLSFELGARQACDRRHRTMGTVHSGKISHLTWTFTKKYWAVLGCTGLYWAVLGHLRYLLGNVQVKWRILPLCIVFALYVNVGICGLWVSKNLRMMEVGWCVTADWTVESIMTGSCVLFTPLHLICTEWRWRAIILS